MKREKLFLVLFVFAALFAACTNEMDEWQARDNTPQNTTELRATRTTISLMSELNAYTLNSSNGIEQTPGYGYYWNQTYTNTAKVSTAHFTFSHTANPGWNYWDGFTISNVADTLQYGIPGLPGDSLHSKPWVTKQWGCMAVPTGATTRPNFIVGYWGFYKDNQHEIDTARVFGENKYSNWVKLGTGTQTYAVSSIKVAMHPWAYYGIKYGDGFANAFTEGQNFNLIVWGVNSNNKFIKASSTAATPQSFVQILANYPDGGSLTMSDTWTDISINFAEPVKYLVFQLFTSDSGAYGPNTATYFCLRDIVMQ